MEVRKLTQTQLEILVAHSADLRAIARSLPPVILEHVSNLIANAQAMCNEGDWLNFGAATVPSNSQAPNVDDTNYIFRQMRAELTEMEEKPVIAIMEAMGLTSAHKTRTEKLNQGVKGLLRR